jgi:hypothetical protein
MAYLLALIFAFLMMTKMQLSSNALMMTDLFFYRRFPMVRLDFPAADMPWSPALAPGALASVASHRLQAP